MKKVLVTGATGEIGEAIARIYAKEGYFVYIHYRSDEKKAQKLLSEIENAELLCFDLAKKQSIKKALSGIEVDVLINCAAIIKDKLFFFMEDDDWEEVINTNLNGYYYVSKQVVSYMIKQKSGAIINVASISGLVGNMGQSNYSASKGGIIAFSKSLCIELARYNIRVNAIAPGVIESKMTENISSDIIKLIPLNRMGKPTEVAEVAFFLGDKGTYINGEVINVSGGMVR